MTTTRSVTEIWFIGNPNSDLNNSCLLTNGELAMSCVTFLRYMCYMRHVLPNIKIPHNQ